MRAYIQYTEGHAYRGWSVSRCASLGGLIMRLQVQMGELFGRLADLALEIYLTPLRALTSHAPWCRRKKTNWRCMGWGSTRTPCINCHRGKYLIVRQPSRGKAFLCLGITSWEEIHIIPIDAERTASESTKQAKRSMLRGAWYFPWAKWLGKHRLI